MRQPELFDVDEPLRAVDWSPTRAAAQARLRTFVSHAGRAYANARNADYGAGDRSNISCLSPWIRHRLLLEEDVVRVILDRHALSTAEKFIQEVFWRTYFKGWMEQRPQVWTCYRAAVQAGLERLETDDALAHDYAAAVEGRTGIDCFDQWARELVETGYLHNHARMWFASIWIFTLNLPWELGADFFYRHLLDGDPASNTLSWRWVGGLHTKGKTYLARPDNIAKYTQGRFNPVGQLAKQAIPVEEPDLGGRASMPVGDRLVEAGPYALLITEDDCAVDRLVLPTPPVAVWGMTATAQRSPQPVGDLAQSFAHGAVTHSVEAASQHFGVPGAFLGEHATWGEVLVEAATDAGVSAIVTPYAPVGPVAEALEQAASMLADSGVRLVRILHPYDALCWPHATKGFFGLKAKIPEFVQALR